MTVEQSGTIDIVGVETSSGNVVLTITDHLVWNNPDKEHLLLLQEKINTYLKFIESGEIYDAYPNAKGRNILISVAGKYPLSKNAEDFFRQASSIITATGVTLRFEVFKPD